MNGWMIWCWRQTGAGTETTAQNGPTDRVAFWRPRLGLGWLGRLNPAESMALSLHHSAVAVVMLQWVPPYDKPRLATQV